MGAYLDAAGLQRRISEAQLTQLTDDLGTGEADPERLAEAIADAEAETDAYLQQRYALPLATVPPLLARVVADLAVWQLFGRRQLADEAVNGRYKAAVRLLEKIASGAVSLGLPTPPEEPGGAMTTNKSDTDRRFGAALLERY